MDFKSCLPMGIFYRISNVVFRGCADIFWNSPFFLFMMILKLSVMHADILTMVTFVMTLNTVRPSFKKLGRLSGGYNLQGQNVCKRFGDSMT